MRFSNVQPASSGTAALARRKPSAAGIISTNSVEGYYSIFTRGSLRAVLAQSSRFPLRTSRRLSTYFLLLADGAVEPCGAAPTRQFLQRLTRKWHWQNRFKRQGTEFF